MESRAEDGQRVYTVREGTTTLGWVVIDRTIDGQARGGLRLVADLSKEELSLAAHSMTLKYGYLGLPQGGAKAGVRGDAEAPMEERRARLRRFARAIKPLLRDRKYIAEPDMGTRAQDIHDMLRSVDLPSEHSRGKEGRSGYYTALSCLSSAEAAAQHLGNPLSAWSVAVEGFGSVGSALALLLKKRGAKVVAISTSCGALHDPKGLDVERLLRISSRAGSQVVNLYEGAERMDRSALLELSVDLLCPCARYHTITEANVSAVKARSICAGANNPLSDAAEQELFQRGVLCLPDFVTNCGGVLGGTMEFASIKPRRIEQLIDATIGRRVKLLLQQSEDQSVLPRSIAERFALRRFEQVSTARSEQTWSQRLFRVGLECHRRGWIPGCLVGALAPRYFLRRMESPPATTRCVK